MSNYMHHEGARLVIVHMDLHVHSYESTHELSIGLMLG